MMIRSMHDLLFSRICVGWSINWKRALLSINSLRAGENKARRVNL